MNNVSLSKDNMLLSLSEHVNDVSLSKDNMLLSLCLPSVEHGGVSRMKPALKKCKCLFSLNNLNTH